MTAEEPPLLAVTMGDPAGIGPEVVLKAASVADVRAVCHLVVFGDGERLRRTAKEIGTNIEVVDVDDVTAARAYTKPNVLAVRSMTNLAGLLDWGVPTLDSDRAQIGYVRAAYDAVADDAADAIVTAPIHKSSLKRAGVRWPGHTEMLAEWCGATRPLMMLAGPTLKVVPITIHVPLRDVPGLLSEEKIVSAIRLAGDALRMYFACRHPRIAVAGLNPHAGEGGMFGEEDEAIIRPAVDACRADGIDVIGPISADTVFNRAVAGEYDVVLGMYHDQALIPLKLIDFDQAVNVTLGLPVIRTSVDHGTAYDIAGRGVASATSMMAAMRLASDMAKCRAAQSA